MQARHFRIHLGSPISLVTLLVVWEEWCMSQSYAKCIIKHLNTHHVNGQCAWTGTYVCTCSVLVWVYHIDISHTHTHTHTHTQTCLTVHNKTCLWSRIDLPLLYTSPSLVSSPLSLSPPFTTPPLLYPCSSVIASFPLSSFCHLSLFPLLVSSPSLSSSHLLSFFLSCPCVLSSSCFLAASYLLYPCLISFPCLIFLFPLLAPPPPISSHLLCPRLLSCREGVEEEGSEGWRWGGGRGAGRRAVGPPSASETRAQQGDTRRRRWSADSRIKLKSVSGSEPEPFHWTLCISADSVQSGKNHPEGGAR